MNDDSGTPKKFSDTELLGRPAFVRVNHVFLNISECAAIMGLLPRF